MADGKRPEPAMAAAPGRELGQASRPAPELAQVPLAQSPLGRSLGPTKAADVGHMSFEDALAELEQIVRGLEGGQQKLEDAITAYERGAALRRHCEAKLAEAEARVAAIVEHADGSLGTRPVD
jgi:exodeoxyribonuclease VII small subunit